MFKVWKLSEVAYRIKLAGEISSLVYHECEN